MERTYPTTYLLMKSGPCAYACKHDGDCDKCKEYGDIRSCPWNVYVTKRYCRLCRERMFSVEQLTKKVSEVSE